MKHLLISSLLLLLPAADIISAVPGNTGSYDLTQVGQRQSRLSATSVQQSICGISFGIGFGHFFEPQFAFKGRLGFALLYDESFTSVNLFSYSVERARTVAHIDLTRDFTMRDGLGLPTPTALKVHDESGLIAVFGEGSHNTQKVLLLSSDAEGRLQKLWTATFAGATEFNPEHLAFNKDGSAIFFIYRSLFAQRFETGERAIYQHMLSKNTVVTHLPDVQPAIPHPEAERITSESDFRRLALIRTEDGALIAETGLPPTASASVLFNEGRDQAVVLMDEKVYVFAPEKDRLEVESRFAVDEELRLHGQGFSSDGRYLIAYAGYVPVAPKRGKNFYYAFDLVQKTARELVVEQDLFPILNAATFHQPTRTLYVPLSSKLVVKNECLRLNFFLGGNRQIDVITLSSDGSLSRSLSFEVPEPGPDSAGRRGLGPEPYRIAISATGALGLISFGTLSTSAGRVLSFDTLTGEIIGESVVERSFATMHLFENLGLFVSTDATENLPVIKINTGPIIERVVVKENRTVIKGSNFLSGVRVRINSEEIEMVDRSPGKPGREIIISRGKKDFPRGQEFSLVVINRDGVQSDPFTISR